MWQSKNTTALIVKGFAGFIYNQLVYRTLEKRDLVTFSTPTKDFATDLKPANECLNIDLNLHNRRKHATAE